MKTFLLQFFTWWNGQTLGTRFHTWRKGERVGEDEFGNVYYRGGTDSEGRTRRWVVFKGYSEATMVPPGWRSWLHHTVETAPSQMDYKPREWQKPHRPNMTGTAGAYHPKGSLANPAGRPKATGDYDAWTPGG